MNTATDSGQSFGRRLVAQARTSRRWFIAAAVLLVISVALWTWRAAGQVVPGAALASWQILLPDLAVAAVVGTVIATLIALIAVAARRRVAWPFVLVWVASAVLLATMGAAGAVRGWWLIVAVTLIAVPMIAVTSRRPASGRGWRGVGLALSVLIVVALIAWLVWPGPSAVRGDAAGAVGTPASGQPPGDLDTGAHQVQQVVYGSGTDRLRSRYGSDVDVVTTAADASGVISNWSPTLTSSWGFDAAHLPRNGVVWRPAEPGRYPLVLIVHGNATAGASELGFDYLGEALAGRGYVVASIDVNFVNTSVLSGSTDNLDAARAWLVLQHLDLWRQWSSAEDGSPLAGITQPDQIALLGHSRGGEAVSVATALNQAQEWPDLPAAILPDTFPIRTVIALAPSDGLYRPGGELVTLQGVNYLTLAGSYDADVLTFAGARQYARVQPGPGQVKAAIALDRANHTQFNSEWGRYDAALGAAKHVLNTGVLLSPAEQREIATGYVLGFLDLSLRGQADQQALFDGSLGAAPFAADVVTRTQFGTGDATHLQPEGAAANEVSLPTRVGPSSVLVTHLSGTGEVGRVFAVPETATGHQIRVDLAGATQPVAPADGAISVEVQDRSGSTATVLLGADHTLAAPLPGRFTKADWLMPAPSSEPALVTYTVTSDQFSAAGVDPERLSRVEVRVTDPDPAGVYLGQVVLAR